MGIMTVKIPYGGWKIKRKIDAYTFLYELISDGEAAFIINSELAYIIEKENGFVRVYEKRGDLYDIFNPYLEVAKDYCNIGGKTPVDYAFTIRKYINQKYFS